MTTVVPEAAHAPDSELNIGVINPFALVEVKLGRKVDWQRTPDAQALLSQVLGVPYRNLFDPTAGSPLYPGLEVDPQSGTARKVAGDEEIAARTLDLQAPVQVAAPGEARAAAGRSDQELDLPGPVGAEPEVGRVAWIDPGDFFQDVTEVFDPIQGAVGDCYLIAALASVAWARPYIIVQRNRATDAAHGFVDEIEFYEGGQVSSVEVSERLPLNTPGNTFIYCRSSDPGEIWPAVYEKAFAKWRTHDKGDEPNIPAIAGGDPVAATATISGLTPYYYGTAAMTDTAIWQAVRGNSLSMKTFNPMVAWTYAKSDPAVGRDYASANLVANHAYSILGWAYINSQMYLVLRNPWGSTEATLNVANGTWVAWDAPYSGAAGSYPTSYGRGFWRSIPLANNDGVFALRADTFKTYFAGFGVCK